IARAVVATTDAPEAARAYGPDGLGLTTAAPVADTDRGVCSVTVSPPAGGVIELVSAVDSGRPVGEAIGRAVADRGEGLHAIVLEADEPGRALSTLAECGMDVGGPGDNEAMVFGARVVIEQRAR
ncbi:MAG: hypothetical protein AAFN30_14580, partial [Actinomycetota bacterium]